MGEPERWKSPLRDLARKLQQTAQDHIAFSQVTELMRVMDDHINAMAYIEEFHRIEAQQQEAQP